MEGGMDGWMDGRVDWWIGGVSMSFFFFFCFSLSIQNTSILGARGNGFGWVDVARSLVSFFCFKRYPNLFPLWVNGGVFNLALFLC